MKATTRRCISTRWRLSRSLTTLTTAKTCSMQALRICWTPLQSSIRSNLWRLTPHSSEMPITSTRKRGSLRRRCLCRNLYPKRPFLSASRQHADAPCTTHTRTLLGSPQNQLSQRVTGTRRLIVKTSRARTISWGMSGSLCIRHLIQFYLGSPAGSKTRLSASSHLRSLCSSRRNRSSRKTNLQKQQTRPRNLKISWPPLMCTAKNKLMVIISSPKKMRSKTSLEVLI